MSLPDIDRVQFRVRAAFWLLRRPSRMRVRAQRNSVTPPQDYNCIVCRSSVQVTASPYPYSRCSRRSLRRCARDTPMAAGRPGSVVPATPDEMNFRNEPDILTSAPPRLLSKVAPARHMPHQRGVSPTDGKTGVRGRLHKIPRQAHQFDRLN
jgi:hypothetical protein